MIDPDIAGRLKPYLMAGERLTWTGRPPAGLVFTGQDALLIPFGLLWGGFAIFWESTVLSMSAPGFMALWGVPFVVIGLYLIVGRFFFDAWVRKGIVYGLTDGRALVLRSRPNERLNVVPIGGAVRVLARNDDVGTLEFGPPVDMFAGLRGWTIWMPSLGDQVRFLKVPGVMDAYRLANPQS